MATDYTQGSWKIEQPMSVTNGPPCHPQGFWICSDQSANAAGDMYAVCSVCRARHPNHVKL